MELTQDSYTPQVVVGFQVGIGVLSNVKQIALGVNHSLCPERTMEGFCVGGDNSLESVG